MGAKKERYLAHSAACIVCGKLCNSRCNLAINADKESNFEGPREFVCSQIGWCCLRCLLKH